MSNHRLRKIGFASTVASGLVLLGLSAHGVSGMDDRLAAAAQAAQMERSLRIELRERGHDGPCPEPRRDSERDDGVDTQL